MATVRPISEKKLEANRANAQKSTGPRTDEGKRASRMNAVSHGLLAQTVVITAGDYQEDEQAFAEVLEGLREDFTPVGVAEDLEVQTIARCYWRRMRAARYEDGAVRMRTGTLRETEEDRREDHFDWALRSGTTLERSSRGIQFLIDTLEEAKQRLVREGRGSVENHEALEKYFPDEFVPPHKDEKQMNEQQTMDKVDELLRQLCPLRDKVAAREELHLESKIGAAALPGPGAVDKLIRYETSNDRQLDRALQRLEAMQARRRKQEDARAEK
jgi:hypothetical protein